MKTTNGGSSNEPLRTSVHSSDLVFSAPSSMVERRPERDLSRAISINIRMNQIKLSESFVPDPDLEATLQRISATSPCQRSVGAPILTRARAAHPTERRAR